MSNYILNNLLASLRELDHKDLENGVHVQIAIAIKQQVAEDKAGAFTKETLVEAYSDAMDTVKLLEARLANVKTWVGDAFMSAREAKWISESGEKSLAKALDFINGDRDQPTEVAGGFIMHGKPGEGVKVNLDIRSTEPEALDEALRKVPPFEGSSASE